MEALLSRPGRWISMFSVQTLRPLARSALHLGAARPTSTTSSLGTEPRVCPAALSTIQGVYGGPPSSLHRTPTGAVEEIIR